MVQYSLVILDSDSEPQLPVSLSLHHEGKQLTLYSIFIVLDDFAYLKLM